MEVQFGPNSVDEPNLLYKLQRKIKVFNTTEPLQNRGYNLVACSSKYGLVFVAVPDGILSVYQLNQLVDKETEPQHLTLQLQEKPTHVAVSCDHELVAITGGQLLSVYKVADFQNSNISPSFSIKTDVNPGTFVSTLQWNPCLPDVIALSYYDGTLMSCQLSTGTNIKVPSKARCFCWSPKGKQLVTGNSDGTLIQYKPNLTAAKMVKAPNLFEGSPIEALAVYWISNFLFAVVYKNTADNSRPAVTIINSPKADQESCLNYEDICYSMGSSRPWYYYLQALPQWRIIMASSSNSMEIGSLGSADGANWVQWCQSDEARPELPLTDKKIENYPVGISIDTCAIHQLPWGENETLPHMPLLHVISQTGQLITFNIINLSKDAMQVCGPPQMLSLPAHAMTSTIPGQAPTPAPAQPAAVPPAAPPAVVRSQKHEPEVSALPQILQPPVPAPQPAQFAAANAAIKIPSFTPQAKLAFGAAPTSEVMEQKPVQEIKPAAPQSQPAPQPPPVTPQPKPQQPVSKPQPTPQQTQENAALKAEQEKINKMKANQELKNMLVKEVNDFQMELYNFMVKTRATQAKLQRDIEAINANFNGTTLNTEELKKECSMEELRGAIVQLKLELVRACAVVAEARTHSDAKELHQWTQADPLTTKRVTSVKKLAYYVQTQLEQAHKALDCKWNEISSNDSQLNRPNKRMIRPVLDDVYQPLVKQQEILARQEAVIRTLKSMLNECDLGPVFKSTSILRSTPFKNKDPLSKLTKNILNMSIEPETKPKQCLLTAQKLDALRDVLSNHKTVKIKPVNVELRQYLANMRKNYEKSLKEKTPQPVSVKSEPVVRQELSAPPINIQPKSEPFKQSTSTPAFAPVSNLKPVAPPLNVARTLFTDEPIQEPQKPQLQSQAFKPFGHAAPTTTAKDTKSVLKDILTNKQANLEAKNSNNFFMGQKICSPTAFGQPAAPTPLAPSAVFTSKPIADISNMFNKLQPQPVAPENKSSLSITPTKPAEVPNVKSSETGELEATETSKPFEFKPKDKGFSVFAVKTPSSATTVIAPDVIKPIKEQKPEPKITIKPLDKLIEKTKENVPEKSIENVPKSENASKTMLKVEKDAVKPFSSQATHKGFAFGALPSLEVPNTETSTSEIKPDSMGEGKTEITKVSEKPDTPASINASAIFASTNASAAAPKPQQATTPPLPSKTESVKSEAELKSKDLSTSPSASSIFGAAVASQPKSTAFSSASIFGSNTEATSPKSVFSSTTPAFGTTTTASSVFGQTNTTDSAFSSTAASIFASANNTSKPSTPPASPPIAPTPAVTSASASIFGPSTVFGTSTTPSFGKSDSIPTTTASVFATKPAESTTLTEAPSAFTPTTTSIFAPTTTIASIFSSATTQPSIFGQAAQSAFGTTAQPSIFGAANQSVFGSGAQSSVFGSTATTATTPSVFGSPTQTTSVFGSPTTQTASAFGSPATTQASIFGTTTQASVFGTPAQATQTSVFGTPTQTTQAPGFGTPTQTNQTSVFGTPTQTTQASIFGQPATTQSGSIFGGESNLFAAASISTTSASSPGSGGNIFGESSSGSVFGGGGGNVFGGKAAFGQNSTGSNIFGGSASFGQKPATNFWGSGNTTGGFGSTGFGQQATTQASSIFGGTTGGSFSQPSAGAFGSPPQQSAFGSPQQQQPAGAFGGSPVFGSKPVFGQAAGFGSPGSGGFGAPAAFGGFNKSPGGGFGAAPAFGGGGGFGGSSPGAGFGSPTQSNSTFESLATQNTLTFGNLAQQSGPPQQAAPTFNTSPSFTGWRG